jgi:RNA polymerase sigma-70 factor, ECF subfamily
MDERDEDLMRQYGEGDLDALNAIFQRYKTPVFNFSLRILGNRADAEDAVSEVFIAVFEKKYRPQPKAKFTTWLFAVAHNVCVSRIRARRNIVSMYFRQEETDELTAWEVPDTGELPREKLNRLQVAAILRQSIRKLPDEQKEALILREYQGMSYEEISVVMQCSLEKVKILIFRAREGLRKELPASLKEERYG